MGRLDGRIALVTGSAAGIGLVIARVFAEEGAHVYLADIQGDAAQAAAADLINNGHQATAIAADVSRGQDITALFRRIETDSGRLDVIVNNAVANGPGAGGLLETSEADWDLVLGVGLRGVFLCCQRAVRQMLTQEPYGDVRGRVINISSQHGMVGAPGALAYSSMKGGVVNLTRQIAVDFAKDGIVCNAIAPGKIVVPREHGQVPEIIAYATARTPWPRLGAPEDVASLAVFMASDDCRFMTGANVLIDGGYMAF